MEKPSREGPSKSIVRCVALKDLKAWSKILSKINDELQAARGNETLRVDAMFDAQFKADYLRDNSERYIDESPSIQREQEDAAILQEQEELMSAHEPQRQKRFYDYVNQTRKERTHGTKKRSTPKA